MKTIFLTWLVALITHNYGWQIPKPENSAESPVATAAKTAKGELMQVGADALLLLQDGTLIREFYVLQNANATASGFSIRYFEFTPGTDKLNITLSEGDLICLKNEGISSKEAANTRIYEGGGLAHISFTIDVNYKRFVELLLEHKNYQQALGQIEYELLVNPGSGGTATEERYPRYSTDCGACAGGGYGALGCSVSVPSFSCTVQCPPSSWACCTVQGGCRCCK